MWARFAAEDALWRSFASDAARRRASYVGEGSRRTPYVTPVHSGVVVDCGSGHTSLMFYSTGGECGSAVRQVRRQHLTHVDGGNLPLTDVLPGASGGAFQGTTLAERLDELITQLKRVIQQVPFEVCVE